MYDRKGRSVLGEPTSQRTNAIIEISHKEAQKAQKEERNSAWSNQKAFCAFCASLWQTAVQMRHCAPEVGGNGVEFHGHTQSLS
jgi:hypothetical protein